MTEERKAEVKKMLDDYIDLLEAANNFSKDMSESYNNEIRIYSQDSIHFGEGITEIFEAIDDKKEVEVELDFTTTYPAPDFKEEKWLVKWYRFHYRGFRIVGMAKVRPAEEL